MAAPALLLSFPRPYATAPMIWQPQQEACQNFGQQSIHTGQHSFSPGGLPVWQNLEKSLMLSSTVQKLTFTLLALDRAKQQPSAAWPTSYMAPPNPYTFPLALQGTCTYPISAAVPYYSAYTPDNGRFNCHNATSVCRLATVARAWCAPAFSAVTVCLLCRFLIQ